MEKPPEGELWETKPAKWCPFCLKVQMNMGEARPAETVNGITYLTFVWRCPACSAK